MKMTRIAIGVLAAVLTTTCWSMVPPKYLSVPNWQSCTGEVTRGTAQFYCLPDSRPAACPKSSWKMLTRQHMMSRCKG